LCRFHRTAFAFVTERFRFTVRAIQFAHSVRLPLPFPSRLFLPLPACVDLFALNVSASRLHQTLRSLVQHTADILPATGRRLANMDAHTTRCVSLVWFCFCARRRQAHLFLPTTGRTVHVSRVPRVYCHTRTFWFAAARLSWTYAFRHAFRWNILRLPFWNCRGFVVTLPWTRYYAFVGLWDGCCTRVCRRASPQRLAARRCAFSSGLYHAHATERFFVAPLVVCYTVYALPRFTQTRLRFPSTTCGCRIAVEPFHGLDVLPYRTFVCLRCTVLAFVCTAFRYLLPPLRAIWVSHAVSTRNAD